MCRAKLWGNSFGDSRSFGPQPVPTMMIDPRAGRLLLVTHSLSYLVTNASSTVKLVFVSQCSSPITDTLALDGFVTLNLSGKPYRLQLLDCGSMRMKKGQVGELNYWDTLSMLLLLTSFMLRKLQSEWSCRVHPLWHKASHYSLSQEGKAVFPAWFKTSRKAFLGLQRLIVQ